MGHRRTASSVCRCHQEDRAAGRLEAINATSKGHGCIRRPCHKQPVCCRRLELSRWPAQGPACQDQVLHLHPLPRCAHQPPLQLCRDVQPFVDSIYICQTALMGADHLLKGSLQRQNSTLLHAGAKKLANSHNIASQDKHGLVGTFTSRALQMQAPYPWCFNSQALPASLQEGGRCP